MTQRPSTIAETLFVLGRGSATARRAALAAATLLVLATLLGTIFSEQTGPQAHYVLALTAGCWVVADLLTALVLLSQFYVTGTAYLAAIGAAYLSIGLLALPYMLYFPGFIFPAAMPLGEQQITPWLWWLRQFVFVAVVAIATLLDPLMRRRVPLGAAIRSRLIATVAAVVAGCLALTAATIAFSKALPVLVIGRAFTPFYADFAVPLLAALYFAGMLVLIARYSKANVLQTWLLVSLFAGLLDAIVDIGSPERFTIGWYTAAFDTIGSAVVVLVALLIEFLRTFYSVNELARFDALTGLRNRRTFDEYFAWALDYSVSRREGIALLMIDVDCFKLFNDRYGHAAGDECLRRVADAVRISVDHSYEIAARYGGEEFVVLLPGADAAAAAKIAERMRGNVERLAILHETSCVIPTVTISIGAAVAADARERDPAEFFGEADRALYRAKETGRNRVCVNAIAQRAAAEAKVSYLRGV